MKKQILTVILIKNVLFGYLNLYAFHPVKTSPIKPPATHVATTTASIPAIATTGTTPISSSAAAISSTDPRETLIPFAPITGGRTSITPLPHSSPPSIVRTTDIPAPVPVGSASALSGLLSPDITKGSLEGKAFLQFLIERAATKKQEAYERYTEGANMESRIINFIAQISYRNLEKILTALDFVHKDLKADIAELKMKK